MLQEQRIMLVFSKGISIESQNNIVQIYRRSDEV